MARPVPASCISLLLAWLVAAAPAVRADVLIRGARLFDGTGAPVRERVDVLVRGNEIAEVGETLHAPGVPVLDAAGLTLLPGLIDSHVHLAAAPGSGLRGDTPAEVRELNRVHLRAFLANGITTIFDPGCPFGVVEDVQAYLAGGGPGPRYLTTGPIVRVPGGYGDDAHGAVESAADVEALFDRIQALGGVGVKLATETALGPFRSFPTYGPELSAAIVEAASRRGLPIYVHAMNEADARRALDLGAHAIVHAPAGGAWRGELFGVSDVSAEYIERLRASGAYQLTTFSLLDTWPGGYDTTRLDDPRLTLTVPAAELATARAPDTFRRFAVAALGYSTPWLPDTLRVWIARWLWTPGRLADGRRYSQRQVERIFRAGVPVVAATDSPSVWPLAPYHFHGPQLAREIALLGGAGLSPAQALQAATRVPAEMLGLSDVIGTVEAGMQADLVLVEGDPLADLRALERVRYTVRGGVVRTPAEWMEAGPPN